MEAAGCLRTRGGLTAVAERREGAEISGDDAARLILEDG